MSDISVSNRNFLTNFPSTPAHELEWHHPTVAFHSHALSARRAFPGMTWRCALMRATSRPRVAARKFAHSAVGAGLSETEKEN